MTVHLLRAGGDWYCGAFPPLDDGPPYGVNGVGMARAHMVDCAACLAVKSTEEVQE